MVEEGGWGPAFHDSEARVDGWVGVPGGGWGGRNRPGPVEKPPPWLPRQGPGFASHSHPPRLRRGRAASRLWCPFRVDPSGHRLLHGHRPGPAAGIRGLGRVPIRVRAAASSLLPSHIKPWTLSRCEGVHFRRSAIPQACVRTTMVVRLDRPCRLVRTTKPTRRYLAHGLLLERLAVSNLCP